MKSNDVCKEHAMARMSITIINSVSWMEIAIDPAPIKGFMVYQFGAGWWRWILLHHLAANFANENDSQEYKKWFTSNIHIHIHRTHVLLTHRHTQIDIEISREKKIVPVLCCGVTGTEWKIVRIFVLLHAIRLRSWLLFRCIDRCHLTYI